MKNLLPLLILLNTHKIIGVLEWTVTGKVTDYGQNVTLFCHVPNCCPKDSGWDRWTPNQRTLFIDVKTGRSNKKYDGRVMKDGYTLVIQNLTKQDLNVSYSCLYGVTLGEQKLLLKEDVFANKSTGQTNVQPGIYEGHIAGIIAVVGVIVAVVVVVSGFHFWRRRKNRKFQFKVENECRTTESVPLMVKGGSSIECREGDDAVFTYTSQTENLSVNLSKVGNETIEKEHANGQYKFLLKNMQKHNSGEYDLQVRTFFRKKFHLNIKELFLEGPSNLECTEGEEAIFTCKVLPDSPSVILRKNDIDITNKCDMLTEECGDKHVIYTLKLKNTNSSDSGEYSLQVGKAVRKVQLKINVYFLEDPSNLEYTEGQDAIFNCKVLSDSPSVVLLKDDIDITNKCDMLTEECGDKNVIYTLTLKNTNSSDSGEYSLQVGKSVRKVQLKINVYFLEDPSDLECTEGEEAIFISKVIPGSPSIVLRIEDKDITNRCEMSKEDCGDTHVIYKLKLKKTQRSDNREYRLQCGKSFRKVHLKINGYFLDDPSDVEVIEGKEAILTCKVRQGSTPVKWLKDGIEIMQNENCVMYDVATEQERKLQLVLNNTKRNDNGEYIVEIGQFSRKLQLEIKSYFLQDPSNVMVIEGEEAILKCRVRQESTSIKWLKAGVEIIQNENCILSNVETQHELHLQLLLKKTKQKNSGEYTVQIGKFSRKLQLKIKTYFLEDPSDTKCIEGEDAIFKCKVCSDSPSVQLLKDGIDITERTNYERTREGQLHELKLVNTSTSDGGDYFVHIGKSHRKVSLIVKEKPSIDEKKSYMEAIKAGTEIRKYVRIQVMGKGRAGKTSLVRRLLHRDINGVESTDGIEIERTCSIKESDGEWRFNTFETEMDKIGKRVLRAVNKNKTSQKSVSNTHVSNNRVFETDIKQDSQNQETSEDLFRQAEKNENRILLTDEKKSLQTNKHMLLQFPESYPLKADDNKSFISKIPKDITEKRNENVISAKFNESIVTDTVDVNAIQPMYETLKNQNDVSLEKSNQITEAMIDFMEDILLEVQNKKENDSSEGLVDCGIWDFAGQKDYYVTHQTFCTLHAIYILVADIREEIKPIQYDDTFTYDSCAEYIDFWLDSVHCIRDDIPESTVTKELRPPVIMVVTGMDKVTDEEGTKEKYREKFLSTFGSQPKGGHKRGMIHFISNINSPDKDLNELRKHISEIAEKMQFFAETLPTRWIQLENALEVLRKLKKKEKMDLRERWENIEKLARKIFIEEKELLNFLNYQHKIGNIIFFKDKPDYIILEPKWLVDCFRCLVCDNEKKTCTETEMYDLKCKGILSDQLIDKLFSKVPGLMIGNSKKYVLDILEKFDVIIKLENAYYMPCMIEKSSTLSDIKNAFNVESSNCTPWLILEFTFLPIAFCNHVLFKYLKDNLICEVKEENGNGRPAIYAGKAVVYLDTTKCRKSIICFSKNAICIQVWKWIDVDDITYWNIVERICNSIEDLEKKLNYKLDYKVKSKCSTGNYLCSSDRITYEDLSTLCVGQSYRCEEHKTMHNKEDIENTWLKHAPILQMQKLDRQEEDKRRKKEESHYKGGRAYYQEYYDHPDEYLYTVDNKETTPTSSLGDSDTERYGEPVIITDTMLKQDSYTITHGTAVTINNQRFDKELMLPNRCGSDVDAGSLFQRFCELGFDTDVLNDATIGDLENKIREIKTDKDTLKKTDCLIVAVLSHGNEDSVYMTDRSIKISRLMEYFSAENCPELILKPKIFIFQTDRGAALGRGVPMRIIRNDQYHRGDYSKTDTECKADVKMYGEPRIPPMKNEIITNTEAVFQQHRAGTFTVVGHYIGDDRYYTPLGKRYTPLGKRCIFDKADFLEVYSTSYGHGSFRNTEVGAPFIRALSEELLRMHKGDDIYKILTRVNKKVGLEYKPNYPNGKCVTQMPCFVSHLTKKLCLKQTY